MVIQEVLITHLANKITAGELQPRGFLLQVTSPAQPEMLLAAVLGMARDIPAGGCHAGMMLVGLGLAYLPPVLMDAVQK